MHRWSKLFIPTLREAPADAEVASHKILLRAGYIRQLGAGIYSYLPLGQRALNKIIAIVRDEMDRIGQEFYLPALNPAELWQESGREAVMGQNLFHLKDRKGAELVLAMTHEEVITSIARNELRSYKQLPQIWYQIQTKFRDEPRPKAGLLRIRQFLMKDSYSFDLNDEGLDKSYNKHDRAYRNIFTRCGLDFVAVEADSGAMGGTGSQEFMVYTEAGEDLIASSASGYAANLEKATSKLAPVEDLAPTSDKPELVHTPGQRTIDEVQAYLNSNFTFELSSRPESSQSHREDAAERPAVLQRHHQIKTMVYVAVFKGENGTASVPVVVLLRGDHEVNETKLTGLVGANYFVLADERSILDTFNAPAGYLGPVELDPLTHEQFDTLWRSGRLPKSLVGGQSLREAAIEGITQQVLWYPKHPLVILDSALEGRTNLIAGANKEDYHYRDVTPIRGDFEWTQIADIRKVVEGDPDIVDGSPIHIGKAVEVGHIFKLGCKYTESMHARVLDASGKEVMPIMGCYGIGIERILTAAIESSAARFASAAPSQTLSSRPERSEAERSAGGTGAAADQYALPPSIAPFEVVITVTNVREADLLATGERLAAELDRAGIDVLLDDRDERAGVKFKDAELIGVPYRVNIGKKLAEGKVEVVDRLLHTSQDVTIESLTAHIQGLLTASKH